MRFSGFGKRMSRRRRSGFAAVPAGDHSQTGDVVFGVARVRHAEIKSAWRSLARSLASAERRISGADSEHASLSRH